MIVPTRRTIYDHKDEKYYFTANFYIYKKVLIFFALYFYSYAIDRNAIHTEVAKIIF